MAPDRSLDVAISRPRSAVPAEYLSAFSCRLKRIQSVIDSCAIGGATAAVDDPENLDAEDEPLEEESVVDMVSADGNPVAKDNRYAYDEAEEY